MGAPSDSCIISNDGVLPACFSAITDFDGTFYHEERDLPHPYSLLDYSWNKVINSVERFIDILEIELLADHIDKSINVKLMDYFTNIIYRSAEYIEDLEGNMSKILTNPSNKRYIDIKGSRFNSNIVLIPCNKLKHNHNRLEPISVEFSGITVRGCRMVHFNKGMLRAHTQVFGREAISFNVEIRRIMAALYFYSADVASKIKSINAKSLKSDYKFDNSKTFMLMKRIINLPSFSMPWENANFMPDIRLTSNKIFVYKKGGAIFPAPDGSRFKVTTVIGGPDSKGVILPGFDSFN